MRVGSGRGANGPSAGDVRAARVMQVRSSDGPSSVGPRVDMRNGGEPTAASGIRMSVHADVRALAVAVCIVPELFQAWNGLFRKNRTEPKQYFNSSIHSNSLGSG